MWLRARGKRVEGIGCLEAKSLCKICCSSLGGWAMKIEGFTALHSEFVNPKP